MTSYRWHPISDLDGDPKELTDGELVSLRRIWTGQKAELTESGTFEEFDKRLRREWAIETGIIEKVYSLDLHSSHNPVASTGHVAVVA